MISFHWDSRWNTVAWIRGNTFPRWNHNVALPIDLRNGSQRRRQIFILLFTRSSSSDIAGTLLQVDINIRPSGIPLKFASSKALPPRIYSIFPRYRWKTILAFGLATMPRQNVALIPNRVSNTERIPIFGKSRSPVALP